MNKAMDDKGRDEVSKTQVREVWEGGRERRGQDLMRSTRKGD